MASLAPKVLELDILAEDDASCFSGVASLLPFLGGTSWSCTVVSDNVNLKELSLGDQIDFSTVFLPTSLTGAVTFSLFIQLVVLCLR